MASRRPGLPYIWVTWLAKAAAGQRCMYSPWFKAHYSYEKYEEMASNLAEWNRNHTHLMTVRRRELEEDGWQVSVEDENAFKMKGRLAVVSGKPDIVASKPGRILVVDGKTGRERDSDIWQVLVYLFAIPKSRPDFKGDLEGEVLYKSGEAISLAASELTHERIDHLVSVIKVIASDTPPEKAPSREECRFCNIGPKDCPQRVREAQPIAVGEF